MNKTYPFSTIHEKIHTVLSEAALPFLDLFDYYKGIPNEHLQVIPVSDSHPNEIGHRIAAEAIYTWLRNTKAVPAEYFAKRVYVRRKDMLDKSIRKSVHESKDSKENAK